MKMTKTATQKLEVIFAHLQSVIPISFPVRMVRKRDKDGPDGTAAFDGASITVTINSVLSVSSQIDTLVHEYAHAMMMDEAYRHGPMWGEKFSTAYNAHIEAVAGRPDYFPKYQP